MGHRQPLSTFFRKLNILVMLSAVLAFSAGHLSAQNQSTAQITGTVTDPSGAPVQGAAISVHSAATNVVVTAKTNNAGVYIVTQLQPGQYDVTIAREGFRSIQRKDIGLQVDQTARVDGKLAVGEVAQVVQVTAAPPLLQTDQTQVETVFSNTITQNLPLVGRDPTQLATLAPATSTAQSQQIGVGTGGSIDPGRINVAGSRAFTINATLDGGSLVLPSSNNFGNMTPALEAVSEFSVVQDNFGAQYGSGSSVLNIVMKSGGQRFHGSLFEFAENDAMNAISRFATAKPKLRFNQFGGTIGGPILPNKLFFFFSYQNTTNPSSVNSIVTVPTLAERGGDFSSLSTPVIDPSTGLPFPGNVIPSARIDQVAAKAAAYWPTPNYGGANATTNNYNRLVPTNPQTPIYDGRLDYTISSAHSLTFSTHHEPYHSSNSGLIPGPACFGGESCGPSDTYDQFYQVNERWVIGPQLVNSAYVTLAREHYANASPTQGGDYPQKLGLNQNEISQLVFPSFSISGTIPTSLGPGSYYAGTQNNVVFSDNLTWVLGKHTLQLGGQFDEQQINNAATYGAPSFAFNGQFTNVGLADFLLGDVYSYGYSAQPISVDGRRHPAAAFIQDEWRARPGLTINAGLRYQYEGAFVEAHNHISNFSPTAINPATGTAGAIVYADSQHPNIQQGHPALFAPRFGFAQSLPRNMVVRGAYGIFYIPLDAQTNFNHSPAGYAINQSLISPTPSSPPVFTLSSGPPAYVTPTAANRTGSIFNGTSVEWWPSNAPQQYLQDWNLSAQKQFGSNLTFEVAYVGSKGTHLLFPRDANQVPQGELGTPEDRTNPQAIRPYPQYLNITAQYNDGISNYNALEVKVNRRMANGLSFLANYTYSNSIDNSSLDTTSSIGNNYQNAYAPQANRSASDYDLTHRGVVAYVYDLPVGRGRRFLSGGGIFDAILGGWTNSGSFNANTGTPFTVYAASPNLTGSMAGTVFANRVGNPSGPHTASEWFNPAAFANPAPYTFGNSGRNSQRGPGAWDFDLSLAKSFPVWRESNFKLRADAFNVFNHTNLLLPNNTLGSTAVGTITSASPARVLEVGGQFSF